MSKFETDQHLSSWAGMSPGNNESAGKKKVPEPPTETNTSNPCQQNVAGELPDAKTAI